MRQASINSALLATVALSLTTIASCDDKGETTAKPTPTAAATAATAKATASATAEAKIADDQICTREAHKVWGKGANPRTGLTATTLPDGRIALGVAFATRPHTLVFDGKGNGELAKVEVKKGTELSKTFPATEAVRHLQRVTVAQGRRTFADYRDKHADKRRRIACGPTDGSAPLLLFDGTPLIDTAHYEPAGSKKTAKAAKPDKSKTADTSKTAKPLAAKKNAKPKSDGKLKLSKSGKGRLEDSAVGKDSTVRDKVGTEAKRIVPKGGNETELRELRDCRTFTDPAGEDVWAVGSELIGKEKAGEETKWTMNFFVAADKARRRIPLHSVALSKTPKKLHTFEAPVAHGLEGGGYVLATRYRGRMFAWLLNDKKAKQGSLKTYGGGYPTLPRVIPDGADHLLLTSQRTDLSHYKLRSIRLGPQHSKLLDALNQPRIGESEDSLAEPTFARAGKDRWLAYQTGDRRAGRVVLVPVDEELAAVGRAVKVTAEKDAVYESHLFALEDGRLLLVYIVQRKTGLAELVSDVLRCQVAI